jgi:hypothetical protein
MAAPLISSFFDARTKGFCRHEVLEIVTEKSKRRIKSKGMRETQICVRYRLEHVNDGGDQEQKHSLDWRLVIIRLLHLLLIHHSIVKFVEIALPALLEAAMS